MKTLGHDESWGNVVQDAEHLAEKAAESDTFWRNRGVYTARENGQQQIREGLVDYCLDRGVIGLQFEACVQSAFELLLRGSCVEICIEQGKQTCREIAAKMDAIRTRFGTKL